MDSSAQAVALSAVVSGLIKSLSFAGSASGLDYDECFDATTNGLWKVDLSWSKEAAELQKYALTMQANKTVLKKAKSVIKHLRIVDKKVSEVDRDLLEFNELEELTLTGNHLASVTAQHLPGGLKVLELCYNRLISLDDLDRRCHGKLEHLGVSYNMISHVELSPHNWPSLVSLDLSYNHLPDLQEACLALVQLSTLRHLLLMGNPLSLVPCYRSFVINSIPNLLCLDDKVIITKERGMAMGVAKLYSENTDLLKTAQLEVSVESLEGLPTLKEVPDDSEDIITRHTIVVRHSFLQPISFISLTPDSELAPPGFASTLTASGDTQAAQSNTVVLKESIYHSDSTHVTPMQAKYRVINLKELTELLASGVDVFICARKLTFCKLKEEESGEQGGASKGRTSAAKLQKTASTGSKSGRNSAASKQVSRTASRKSVQTPTDKKHSDTKGKKKSNQAAASLQQARLPSEEEGWRVDKMEEIPLGTVHVSLSSLLERSKRSSLQDTFAITLQQQELEDVGMFEWPAAEATEGVRFEDSNPPEEKNEDKVLNCVLEVQLQTTTSDQQ